MSENGSEKYKVYIEGVRPLLMNSCQSMIDERKETPSRGKEKKSPKEEAEKLLYRDGGGGIVVPSLAIMACLRKSATNFKVPGRGKKTYKDFIYAGIKVEPVDIPLITEDGWKVDLRPVVINRARIVKARPKFDNWALSFQMEITDVVITPDVLKEMLSDAGRYNGLLDFRPLFGLFELKQFERMEG